MSDPRPLDADDPRVTRPILTIREAARGLGVRESTFRDWARGYSHTTLAGSKRLHSAVVTSLPDRGRDASVPFVGVVEGLVLAAFRASGVPLQRIRPALDELSRQVGLSHALASQRLYTDGAEILYEYPDGDIRDLVVIRSGQRTFREAIEQYLQRITFGDDGWPAMIELPAFGHASIVIDPVRAFGRPLFRHGGARLEDVIGRWHAGDSLSDLAEDYGIPIEEIEDAARTTARAAA